MVAKAFEIGDLVWAQMKGFPHWPAKIVEPPPEKMKTPGKKSYHFVYFFGSKNYSWIMDEKIVHHSEEMLQVASKKKHGGLQKGVEELISESKLSSKELKSPPKMTNDESNETISPERKTDKTIIKVAEPKDGPLVKEPVSQPKKVTLGKQPNNKPPKKRRMNENDEDVFHTRNGSQSKKVRPAKQPKKKSKKRRSRTATDEECPPAKTIPSSDSKDSYSMLFTSILSSIGAEPLLHIIPPPPTK